MMLVGTLANWTQKRLVVICTFVLSKEQLRMKRFVQERRRLVRKVSQIFSSLEKTSSWFKYFLMQSIWRREGTVRKMVRLMTKAMAKKKKELKLRTMMAMDIVPMLKTLPVKRNGKRAQNDLTSWIFSLIQAAPRLKFDTSHPNPNPPQNWPKLWMSGNTTKIWKKRASPSRQNTNKREILITFY